MILLPFLCFCLIAVLTVSSSLSILDKRLHCKQPGLDHCKFNNCSEQRVVARRDDAPTGPDWASEHVEVGMDRHGLVPVMNVTWRIKADGSIRTLRGSEINIVEESTNQSVCVQYSYNITKLLNPNYSRWTFSLDEVVVEPGYTYMVSVFNLPQPETGDYTIRKQITIPGCGDRRIQKVQLCLENGSLWNPQSVTVSVNTKDKIYYPLQTLILKTTLGLLMGGGCLAYLLWRTFHKDPLSTSSSADKGQPEIFQLQERKRVLIIYSLDHPLYKNIILKLCAFLASKCGTDVVLDLLDSTRLGVLGSIQWLEWHKEQIESSSDKILILCSRGVQAKWRAMCGDKQVFLREDACSLVGDMLTPSLSLMVPHFIRSTSFKKYIVAYFDDICSEEDIPSPFNVTVRYKLMKQFEEVFFRILDTEKHEPGRVKQIEGLSEDKYHQCPSGRALRDAIQAFHAYQLEHPHWFEEELLESSELEVEGNSDEMYECA